MIINNKEYIKIIIGDRCGEIVTISDAGTPKNRDVTVTLVCKEKDEIFPWLSKIDGELPYPRGAP